MSDIFVYFLPGRQAFLIRVVTMVLMRSPLLLSRVGLFFPFSEPGDGLNGDTSILARLLWLLDIGGSVWELGWEAGDNHPPFQSFSCLGRFLLAQARSRGTY